jgi:hydrogenase nickel incorporation protein HypA/HybF
MHEISLVRNIFITLKKEYPVLDMHTVKKIYLQTGILSGVEPLLMQNAFEAVVSTENPEFKNCLLDVTIIPVVVLCTLCDSYSEIDNYKFVCSKCQSPCNNIIQGTELNISAIEVDD